MNLCRVSLKIRNNAGQEVPGVVITTESVYDANGNRASTYEITKVTDATGDVYFDAPQRGRIRFASAAVPEVNGWTKRVPAGTEIFLGVFQSLASVGVFETAQETPDGERDTFTFASGLPKMVFVNGVNETRFCTFLDGAVVFSERHIPQIGDDVEGII